MHPYGVYILRSNIVFNYYGGIKCLYCKTVNQKGLLLTPIHRMILCVTEHSFPSS